MTIMRLRKHSKYLKTIRIIIYGFAIVGVVLSVLLATIVFRPHVLELVGIKEVSGELYTCMTYKDPALLQQIYNGEINLKEAREIADAREDTADEYTECLTEIFGYNTVWVNEKSYIIYD